MGFYVLSRDSSSQYKKVTICEITITRAYPNLPHSRNVLTFNLIKFSTPSFQQLHIQQLLTVFYNVILILFNAF